MATSKKTKGRMPQGEADLGLTARDIITGFQGVITYQVKFLTGCNQYGLQAPKADTPKGEGEKQFDEGRLEIIESIPRVTMNTASEKPPIKGGSQKFVGK